MKKSIFRLSPEATLEAYDLSLPGYHVALVPTDSSERYFHLALIARNQADTKNVIHELGGPFAFEEFAAHLFTNPQTDDLDRDSAPAPPRPRPASGGPNEAPAPPQSSHGPDHQT